MGPSLLTLSLMTLSVVAAVPLGVLWGWSIFHLRRRPDGLGGRAAEQLGRACTLVMVMMLALPLYVHAAGWEGSAGKFGWLPLVAPGQRSWFQGLVAASWIHATYGACWIGILTVAGLRGVSAGIIAAARMDSGPRGRDLCIRLPIALPWIAAGCAWVALVAVTEMTVADLYGVGTLADVVYKVYALDPEPIPVVASVLLPAVVTTPLILWVASRGRHFHWSLRGGGIISDRDRAGAGGEGSPAEPQPWGATPRLCVIAAAMTTLVAGVPVASLVVKAGWTVVPEGDGITHVFTTSQFLATMRDSFGTFGREIGWTSQLAMFSVLLSVPIAWILAAASHRRPAIRTPTMVLMLLMVMVPGPVVSLVVIEVFNRPSLGILYDRTLIPTLVALMPRTIPAAYLILRGGYRLLDPGVDELAVLDGCGPFARILRIDAPRLRRAIGFAALAVVLVAVADLSSTLLVLPPGVSTVASRLFGLLHSGVRHQEAGLALLAAFATAAVTVLGLRWLRL